MDRFDSRVLLLLASMLLSLGLLCGSYAESLPVLFFCIAVSGASTSMHIQAISTLQPWFSEKKGIATGIAMAGSGLGNTVFAMALGFYFANPSNSWRNALRWEALFCLLFAAPASLLLKKRKHTNKAHQGTTGAMTKPTVSLWTLMSDRRMLSIFMAKFTAAFAYGVPFVHLIPLMNDKGLSEIFQAAALALIGVASLSGRIILGAAGDRVGHVRLFQFGFTQLALALFLFPHCRGPVAFCFVAFYYGFFAGGYPSLPPTIISIWFANQPGKIGRLVGLNFFADTVGAVSGPVIVGFLYDNSTTGNYVGGYTFAGCVMVLATMFAFTMPRATVPDITVDIQ
jgi:predicted MFS family arabinose efflux permease